MRFKIICVCFKAESDAKGNYIVGLYKSMGKEKLIQIVSLLSEGNKIT